MVDDVLYIFPSERARLGQRELRPFILPYVWTSQAAPVSRVDLRISTARTNSTETWEQTRRSSAVSAATLAERKVAFGMNIMPLDAKFAAACISPPTAAELLAGGLFSAPPKEDPFRRAFSAADALAGTTRFAQSRFVARAMITVVETAGFIAAAARLLTRTNVLASSKCWLATQNAETSSRERAASGRSASDSPDAEKAVVGELSTYLNEGMPLFALMVYAKNQAAQLTKAQEKSLAAIASGIKKTKKERT